MISSVALSTAVSGLNASAQQLRVAAHNIVNADTEGFQAQAVKNVAQVANGAGVGVTTEIVSTNRDVDLARELVGVSLARVSYAANAKVIGSLEETLGTVLDISA